VADETAVVNHQDADAPQTVLADEVDKYVHGGWSEEEPADPPVAKKSTK
jgi:hypothetical protein